MRTIQISLLTLLFLAGLMLPAVALDEEKEMEPDRTWAWNYFPVEYGSYWLYEGQARLPLADGNMIEKTVILRTEVVDETIGNYDLVFSCKGYFTDILKLPKEHLASKQPIIEVPTIPFVYELKDSFLYYRMAPQKNHTNVIKSHPVLYFPLEVGKSFASAGVALHADHTNAWYVMEKTPSQKWQVNDKPGTEYHLIYETDHERTEMCFVPGIGYTRYIFHQKDGKRDVDVELKEYGLGK